MKLFKNMRISSIGWAFVVTMLFGGAMIATSSLFTINSIATIKTTWDAFEESRSAKGAALNALRKEIGYGGMIHQFKNFVLRHDVDRVGIVNAKLGGAASAIARYRALGLNEEERGAISDIQNMLAAYTQALSRATNLVSQGKSQTEIDALVRVNDTAAIQGLDVLDAEVTKVTGANAERPNKSQAIASLRKAMGYGGMIHNFKNMVLRPGDETRDTTNQDIAAALGAIRLYSERSLTVSERKALNNISGVINAYKMALDTVDQFAKQGKSPAALDLAVKIDDVPALEGLDTLTREIFLQNKIEETKVNTALALVISITKAANLLLLAVISLLIIAVLWLTRTQITGPIARMTDIMTRLAAGDLDLEVVGKKQNNEIGEMGRAVEVFRNTAIEQKNGEQALRDREQRMSAILNNVVDGIITIDQAGTIDTFNPAAQRLFGYVSEEVVGKNVKCLMPEPYHSEHDGYLDNYHNSGVAKIIGSGREVIGQRKDGSTFPMELAVSRMLVGEKTMFTGIVRNISERKQAEKTKTEFISTVSHELRTPLTSIKGSLGLIKSGAVGELPEKLNRMLEIAYTNSDRLVRLINDILDIEKIAAGKMDFHMAPVELNGLLEQAVDANKGYGTEHGVSFVLSSGGGEANVNGDPDRLMQVLANLMSNAAKFSPAEGTVEISLIQRDHQFRIAVRDQGPGIPEDFKDKIFGKFSQADSSDTRQKGGTGLGLNITKAIVEQHGGTIGFDSEVGAGSTFFFDLPQLQDQPSVPVVAAPDHPQYHILICEDDPDISTLLDLMLQQDGYTTDVAKTAAQAEAFLAQNTYDAMTLDLGLPDKDGITLFRELRQNPKTKDLPIIVISANATKGALDLNGDAIGIIDWIEKPIDQQRLSDDLRRAVSSSSNGKARILHVEDDPDIIQIVKSVVGGLAEIIPAMTLSKARSLLEQQAFDLVVLDLMLPDGAGEELLSLLQKGNNESIPAIVFSGQEISKKTAENIKAVLVKSKTTNESLLATILSSIEARK